MLPGLCRFARASRELVFPQRCPLCADGLPPGAARFCSCCADLLADERAESACPRCAATVGPYEVSGGRCRQCRHRRLNAKATVRVAEYRACLGQLIRSYKYHGREELEPVLIRWLIEVVADAPWLDRVEAVVSVPTHWKHRLGRPLYPAEILAARVARETGLPHVPILRRLRAGPHQVGLSYDLRTANVRGAFDTRPGVKLRDARLLLIDDVRTTGATIEECAKVLRHAGASEVYAAVLVRVVFTPGVGRFPRTI